MSRLNFLYRTELPHRAVRVSDHMGAVHLHQVWLHEKACLA